ncbi:MAG: M56 family metallopeptidase [Lachnospiraceae bacterium]|nr:M56 family metallopeptidase [Lachnospiraceae bacterium]
MLNQIISSSIIILVVLSIRSLCGKYIGQRFKYALWIVIAVKLLIPMPFENPINVINYFPSESNAVVHIMDNNESEDISGIATENTRQVSSVHTGNEKTSPANNNDTIAKTESIRPTAGIEDKVSGIQIIEWIWIIGIVFFAGYLLINNIIFSVKLRRKRKYIEKYRDALPVYITSLVHSPCLFGIIKPAIYLPDGWKISEKYRDYILLHEWIHCRHKDMIWSLIRSICLTIYWFHPLVWVSYILSKRDCETACDEGVMAVLGDEKKADYSRMLVDICAMISKDSRNYILMQELRGGHREMKTRLSLLIKKSLPMTWMIILVAGISVGAVGCTFGTKTVTDTDSNQEKEQQISMNEPAEAETAISVTEANPDLTQGTGADGAMLYYADENRIIFGGSFGLFVYDTVNQKMLRSVDLVTIGCSDTQGDKYCEIQVSEDGGQVYLHPMNITDMYIYDVEKNSLKKETYDLTGISLYSGVQKGNSSAVYQTSEGKAELHLSHAWTEIGQLGYHISGEGPVKKFFVPDEYNKAPLLASSDFHRLKKAEMMFHGRMCTCDSAEALQKLEKIISKAKVIEGYPACPFEDALYLTKEDGSMGVIYPATDSCNVIGTADGYVEFGDSDNSKSGHSKLWDLLGWNPRDLW